MALTTRRQSVQQTAFAVAALYDRPIRTLAKVQRVLRESENKAASVDSLVRKLASQISGNVTTPETSGYGSARLVFNRAFDRHRH